MEVLNKKGILDDQLQMSVIICDSMTTEEQKALNLARYRNGFAALLNNLEFMREIQKLKIINTNVELSLAYYGENFGHDPNVEYDEELQTQMLNIEKEIRDFLGIIMNHILAIETLELE